MGKKSLIDNEKISLIDEDFFSLSEEMQKSFKDIEFSDVEIPFPKVNGLTITKTPIYRYLDLFLGFVQEKLKPIYSVITIYNPIKKSNDEFDVIEKFNDKTIKEKINNCYEEYLNTLPSDGEVRTNFFQKIYTSELSALRWVTFNNNSESFEFKLKSESDSLKINEILKNYVAAHKKFSEIDGNTYITYIPSLFDSEQKKGIGGIILISSGDYDASIKEELSLITPTCLNELGIKYVTEFSRKAQIKSAISAIMSRNMSHNLGSHVFYYTRQRFLEIYEKEKENSEFEYPNEIKGISWFLHYVQERQDFVANINSGDKYIYGPLNLKQDVIDEIAPDAMDFRHLPPNDVNRQITKNFLLENIVRSENIARHFKGESQTDDEKLADLKIELNYLVSGNDPISFQVVNNGKDASQQVKQEFYNINFAVQGGQQSRHALLIILENIIRNSAKHAFGKSKVQTELKISIDIEKQGYEYNISIYDNTGNAETALYDNTGNKKTALEVLQESLKSIKLLDDKTNEIDRTSKGLKEILICVLWMKDLDFGDIEKYARDGDILKIENKNENIAYSFSLPIFQPKAELSSKEIKSIIENKEKTEPKKHAFIFYPAEDVSDISDIENRIPRFVNEKGGSNLWEKLQKKFNNIEGRNILLFDKTNDKTETNNDNVEILHPKHLSFATSKSNSIVYFHNHMAKNNQQLKEALKNTNPEDKIILESLSGANQAFNLMQRFTKSVNSNNMTDLYWNTVINYQTKIVIVDERLSYSNKYFNLETDVKKVKNKELFVNDIFNKSGIEYGKTSFIDACEENIFKAIDSVYLELEQKKYALPNKDEFCEYKNIPKIEQDLYEKFKFQQNTFPFNLDISSKRIINSLGNSDKPFLGYLEFDNEKYKVDFFTIHVGFIDKLKKQKRVNTTIWEIVNEILDANNIDAKYICVHSGRGGLNDKNDGITFIPFSILQRCYEDSKFLLSEFFYNNQYMPNPKKQ